MADTQLQAESACANPADAIHQLALDVQAASRRARHLLAAMDDANEKASFPGTDDATRLNMLDRVHAFYELAAAALKEVDDKAEKIETLSMAIKRQANA